MALNIKENITTINHYPERYGYKVKACIIHSTWGSYRGSVQWFKNPAARCSAHYVVKEDGEVSLCVQEEATAWHAGVVTVSKEKAPRVIKDNWGINPNFISIGVEVTDNRKRNWSYPTPQYMAVVYLVADICWRYKIESSRDYILMHKETDPVNRSDPVGNWDHDKFVADVCTVIRTEYETLKEWISIGRVRVRSDISGVRIRKGPSRLAEDLGYHMPKDTFNVVGFVEGAEVTVNIGGNDVTSNIWWKDVDGHFVTSTCIVETPNKNLDGKDGEYSMTKEEKDALLGELEARIAEVKEVPVEEPVAEEVKTEEVVVEPTVETPAEAVVEDPTAPVVTPEGTPEVVEVPSEEKAVEPTLMDRFNALVEEFRVKIAALM